MSISYSASSGFKRFCLGNSDHAVEKTAGLYFAAPDKIRYGLYDRSFFPGTAAIATGLMFSRTGRLRLRSGRQWERKKTCWRAG